VKTTAWLFGLGCPLFVVFAIAYGIVSHWDEPAGLACLFLTAALAFLVAAYVGYTARHVGDQLEDDPFGEIADGAGELGEFSPYSWWPLAVAFGGAVIFLGAAIGFWLSFIGALFSGVAVVGWVFEYYRGEHAH
jgi:hypothetical protein